MTWGWCRSCYGNPIAGECRGIGRSVGLLLWMECVSEWSLKQHNNPLRPADRRGNLLGNFTVIYKYCEKGWEAEMKTCCESKERNTPCLLIGVG